MVTIGMNYRIRAGKEEAFEGRFQAVLVAMDDAEGHTETHLYKDALEGDRYLVVSEWADRESFDAFVASETFAEVTRWGLEQILVDRPTHQVYEAAA